MQQQEQTLQMSACDAGLVAGGFVNPATCVWREGCSAWLPISEVQELAHLLQYAPGSTAASGAAVSGPSAAGAAEAAAVAAGAAGQQHAPVQLSRPAAVK